MEPDAVLTLFDRFADAVYRVALSYLRSPQEAEDAVQTIFLKLLEKNVEIHPNKERVFLTKMTINHCKNILSSAKTRSTVPLDETVPLVQPEDQELFARSWSCRRSTGPWSACIILRATPSRRSPSSWAPAPPPSPCAWFGPGPF